MTAFYLRKTLTEIFDNGVQNEFKHLFNNKAGIFIVIFGLTLNLMGLENVDRSLN